MKTRHRSLHSISNQSVFSLLTSCEREEKSNVSFRWFWPLHPSWRETFDSASPRVRSSINFSDTKQNTPSSSVQDWQTSKSISHKFLIWGIYSDGIFTLLVIRTKTVLPWFSRKDSKSLFNIPFHERWSKASVRRAGLCSILQNCTPVNPCLVTGSNYLVWHLLGERQYHFRITLL